MFAWTWCSHGTYHCNHCIYHIFILRFWSGHVAQLGIQGWDCPTRSWWKWRSGSRNTLASSRVLARRMLEVTLWWTNILPWKITIFNGKIHYFYGHFPLLFVCSPEGRWIGARHPRLDPTFQGDVSILVEKKTAVKWSFSRESTKSQVSFMWWLL